MTQTLDSPSLTPPRRAETWLRGLEDALRDRDVARAAGMFAAGCGRRLTVSATLHSNTTGVVAKHFVLDAAHRGPHGR